MKKIVYYAVEKETRTDVYEECTGIKDIRIYHIVDNNLILIDSIEGNNEENSYNLVLDYLSTTEFGIESLELIEL